MNRLNNILFATDFSEASQHALEHAAVVAAKNDATLHVVHVRVLLNDMYGQRDFPARTEYQQALDTFAKDNIEGIAPKFDVPIKRKIVRDVAAAPAIVEYVKHNAIDLVVLGSHGRTGLAHVLLGSVAQEVVRHCPVNVLVVGHNDDHAIHPEGYRTIACAIDFSLHSKRALKDAAALAMAHQAKLVVMHVISTVPHPAYYMAASDVLSDVFPRLESFAKKQMAELVAELALPENVDVETLILEGVIHEKINEVTRQHNASVLVVGTEGNTGLERFLLGSVAEKVLRTAPCPVLAVKAVEPSNI